VSLVFARALAEFMSAHGVQVTWEPGAEVRGNGQVSAYQGVSVHHTATASSTKSPGVLTAGRPDLSAPLCNSSGPSDGRFHIVAVNPANHAGASGGWDTAPLPKTGLFNKLMWGHETVYEGTKPMNDAQYRTATILGAGVCRLLGHDYDPRWVKFHQGTSVTGKWDPGYASGKTYDINEFRSKVLIVMKGQAPAPVQIKTSEDDTMYISCAKKNVTAIYSGGILTGLASAGEIKSMEGEVAAGRAARQWVEDFTFDALDRRSKLLTGEIKPST
jgi:hypothetical protein